MRVSPSSFSSAEEKDVFIVEEKLKLLVLLFNPKNQEFNSQKLKFCQLKKICWDKSYILLEVGISNL